MRSLRTAVSLFTVIPVGGEPELRDGDAARAVLWMPVVGLLLALAGAGVVIGVDAGGSSGPRRLLGAALAVGLIALLTGGLHLDGLADTADGLGSRRGPADALTLMRRPDAGPMGVAALVLVLVIQVSALAAVPDRAAAASLVLAEVTGRVAVVVATGSPAARPGGFGALVAGQTSPQARWLAAALLGCAIVVAGIASDGAGLAIRGLVAAVAGLLSGGLLQLVARRRLGGMTGDVFGAIVEVSAATVLVVCALLS